MYSLRAKVTIQLGGDIMNRYVLTGRVFDGKRLIAIKITEIESLNSRFIPKNKLDKLFREVQVINCMYKYGSLREKNKTRR